MNAAYRQRLAQEYRYASDKMQQSANPARKLYYFSILFGEAQRVLNWEWDRNLALIHMVALDVHKQITAQIPAFGVLPINGDVIFEKLTQTVSDLATYFENLGNEEDNSRLCQILARLAEIGYAVSGNGSYLYEKGLIKL